MQFTFKTGEDTDNALAFALRMAFGATRLLGAANQVTGTPGQRIIGTHKTRDHLLPYGTRRGPALRGVDLAREAQLQSYRLLYEDIDAAWGKTDQAGAYAERLQWRAHVRSRGLPVAPEHPVNTELRGLARLDEAFEETFNV